MTNWKSIHQEFTPELQQKWENNSFTYQQTQDWINIGLHPQDFSYVIWLRDIKQVDSDWMLNYGNEETLREEYQYYEEYSQPSWKAFYKWLQKEVITFDDNSQQVKVKPTKQNQYGQISTQTLTNFCDSLEATLDNQSDYHLFPEFDQNKNFEELFPSSACCFGKKTFQQTLNNEDYSLLEKLFVEWKETMGISQQRAGGKSTQEFIAHLKTLYENCSVYFDIQEKMMIVKNQRTKEEREEEVKYADEFKRMRIRYQELRSMGRTDLPEPPATTEECYGDRVYQPGEERFQWLVAKLDEWEVNQNKRVESVSSLIEFLEWTTTEEEKLAKKVYAQEAGKNFLTLINKLHEYQQQYSQMSEEEREFNDRRENLLSQLDNQQIKLINYRSKIEELTAELPHLENQESIDSNNLLINKTKEITELLEEEIENTLSMLKRLKLEEEIAELEKERDKILAEAAHNDGQGMRNILLIGRTGSGKSTLGNVLVNKDGNFEEVFKESSGSVSQTKEIKTEKFTIDISRDRTEQINYLVIDTAGFGDTQLSEKEVLQLLKDLVPIIKDNGINQIFFVSNGRFTEKEVDAYKLLENVLFDKNAANYTTIVRTKFPSFENHGVCEEDERRLRVGNNEIARILQTSRIIYIDNPPLEGRPGVIEVNKETREISRRRLLTYLGTCQNSYKASNLEELNERINDYMSQEEKLNKEIADKEQKIKEREAELQKEVEAIQQQKTRDLRITGKNFERQTKELQEQNTKKIQTTRQELEEVSREQLRQSQEAYNETLNQISNDCQSNLSQIRNSFNQVRVGKPICRYGHSYNIQVYNKSGSLVPNYQSDFIDHIYCPTCGTNDYDFTLHNAITYTLEEWGRKFAEQAAERSRRLAEAIQEQEQQRSDVINRIMQERNRREAVFREELELQRERDELLLDKQRIEREINLRQQRQNLEERINSNASSQETNLRNQSNQQIQGWQAQIQQAEQGINVAKQVLFGVFPFLNLK